MMYLNHSRAELKKFSKSKLVSIGTQILKRFPKKALPGTIYVMEQSAKRYGIKSIGKIARKAGKKVRKAGKKVRRRAKTAMSYPRSRGGTRYTNGRTFKSKRKSAKYQGKEILIARNGQPYIKKANGEVRFIPRIYA